MHDDAEKEGGDKHDEYADCAKPQRLEQVPLKRRRRFFNLELVGVEEVFARGHSASTRGSAISSSKRNTRM